MRTFPIVYTKGMRSYSTITAGANPCVFINMENFRIFVRGHNLFDIFYGKYSKEEEERILRRYIDIAPRENFEDIFEAIDKFVYFENRKKEDSDEE